MYFMEKHNIEPQITQTWKSNILSKRLPQTINI